MAFQFELPAGQATHDFFAESQSGFAGSRSKQLTQRSPFHTGVALPASSQVWQKGEPARSPTPLGQLATHVLEFVSQYGIFFSGNAISQNVHRY